MELTIDLPWLAQPLERLEARRDRMPHALLIHGAPGIGKRMLATRVARGLLCEATLRVAGGCGACAACRWFSQRNHPDYRLVTTEALAVAEGLAADDEGSDGDGGAKSKKAPSREIRIEQVRALADFASVATHRGGPRVLQVQPLDAMNEVSANALLKLLEEPPRNTVFLAVTDHVGRITPTILSRCQQVPIAPPSIEVARAWLEAQGVDDPDGALAATGGAPLAALAAAGDADARALRDALLGFLARPAADAASRLADALAKAPAHPIVTWLGQWLADCLSMRLARRVRYHPAHSAAIDALVSQASLDRLLAFQDRLALVRRTIDHPLNQRLMLESLFIGYAEALRASR